MLYNMKLIKTAGNWSVSCHNNDHFEAGMKTIYRVHPCGDHSEPFQYQSGVTRTYFIAAVEKRWNYSPNTIHPVTGEDYSNPNS